MTRRQCVVCDRWFTPKYKSEQLCDTCRTEFDCVRVKLRDPIDPQLQLLL